MHKKDNQNLIPIYIDDSQYLREHLREQEKKIKKIKDEYKEKEREERARNEERFDEHQRLLESIASSLEDQKYEAEEKKKQREEQQRQLEEDKKNTIQKNNYRKLSRVLPISSNIKQGKIFSASELQNEVNMIYDQIEKLNQNGMSNLCIKFYQPKKSPDFELTDKKNPYYFKLEKIEAINTYRFKKHSYEPEKIKYLWGSKCEVHFKMLTSKETLIELKVRAERRAEQERLRAEERLRRKAEKIELDDVMSPMEVARMPLADRLKAINKKTLKPKPAKSKLSNPKAPHVAYKHRIPMDNPSYFYPQPTPNETSQSSLFNFESSVRRLLATILTKISNLFASTIIKILDFIIRKNDSKEKNGKPTGR